jgi:hypothetical protein
MEINYTPTGSTVYRVLIFGAVHIRLIEATLISVQDMRYRDLLKNYQIGSVHAREATLHQ